MDEAEDPFEKDEVLLPDDALREEAARCTHCMQFPSGRLTQICCNWSQIRFPNCAQVVPLQALEEREEEIDDMLLLFPDEFADEFPLLPWLPHADPPKKLGHCQLVPQHKGESKKQKGPGGVQPVLLAEEFVLLC